MTKSSLFVPSFEIETVLDLEGVLEEEKVEGCLFDVENTLILPWGNGGMSDEVISLINRLKERLQIAFITNHNLDGMKNYFSELFHDILQVHL